MAASDLEVKVKVIADEMEKHTAAGKVSDKQANSFKATLSEFERLIKTASSPSDWLKIKSLVNKLGNTLLDVTSSLNDVSKEAVEYAKELAKAEKAQEKVNAKIEKNIRGKGYQVNEDLGKVTGLRKSAASGQDSWEKIFEEQQKGANAILGQNGKPLAWSTFQTKLKAGNFTDEQKGNVEVFERSIKERIDNADKQYQELRAELEQYKAELLRLQANPPQKGSNTAFDDALNKVNAAKQEAEGKYSGSKPSDVDYGSPEDFNKLTQSIDKQSTSLGKAFKQFSIYAIALRTVKKAVNEATRTIKDLDKYLTTQAMVTNKTRKETYELLKTYQSMASQLGATTKEVADVATQFMRQGKSTADALTLTTAAISAAKVAGINVTESVNYLTTALNGFQISAENAMKVSDKFAAIAAQSATSYEEIATALSKVAAQANMAGMSIDYTTAILAKGIETTREAPETIGTALKTIIARMRELGDYGQTLEDGMNINNVEKQLKYVGIELRNEVGELRSTEDVLDELGRKWTELSSNQQAAVAKALAGTRQQSRLIAMMTDYERVIELQQIAQRSAGATAAQAATYMEGMEAALNKVNVAWEKIVTTVTDSEVIINIINRASDLLNGIANFLSNDIALFSTLAVIAATTLTHFIAKFETQKAINRAALQKEKSDRNELILEKQKQKAQLQTYIDQLKAYKTEMKILGAKRQEYLLEMGMDPVLAKQVAMLEDEAAIDAEIAKAEGEQKVLDTEINGLKIQQLNTDLQIKENAAGIAGTFGKFAGLLTPVISILTIINTLQQAHNAKLAKESLLLKKNTIEQTKNNAAKGTGMFAGIVSAFSSAGIPGVIAGIALATALVAALGLGIAAMTGAFSGSGQSIGDSFNKTSNEIYKLSEKSNNLKQIISDFEDIDNKIIKTNEDIKEMNKLLETAADKLNDEEKAEYALLVSQQARLEYLKKRQEAADKEAKEKRDEQIRALQFYRAIGMGNMVQGWLTGTDSDALAVQSAIIANNNDAIYRYIDSIGGAAEGVEYFTQSIFENMDALDAYRYATEEGRKELEKIIDIINSTKNAEGTAFAEIINSEDYTLTERLDAYQQLLATLQQVGDPALTKSLMETYKQWQMLGDTMSGVALKFMEQYGVTIDELNDLSKALQKLGYDAIESATKISQLFELMANGAEISDAIWSVFGLTKDDDGYLKILNAYQKAAGKTILDMGQNLQAFKSQINSVYEMVGKWSTLSDSEKTQFLNENADLFKGTSGTALYRAFETGNYDVIEQALRENEYLQKQLELRKQELQVQLDIEKAREGTEEYDIATVQYLEEQLALLEDMENIFKADLKLRVEQENAQLDIYKTYLQKQQDALTESLDKRKDAYQKYFDAINQDAEDEDYKEQANTLITNLSKLASSTNADSMKQSKELEKQLEELEKERLNTLRERAQEAVMQNLEDEVSEINEKFDKLLENNQALLQMMRQDLTNPEQFVADMLNSNVNNMTALGAEQWIEETLKAAFGSKIDSSILDGITVRENGNNLVLNIAGEPIELGEASQKDLADTILRALRQLGISI